MIITRTLGHQVFYLRIEVATNEVHMHVGDDRSVILPDPITLDELQARTLAAKLLQLADGLKAYRDYHSVDLTVSRDCKRIPSAPCSGGQ